MNVNFEQGENGRFVLDPASRAALLDLHPWQRYATYHEACRRIYREKHPDAASGSTPEISVTGFQSFPALIPSSEVDLLTELLSSGVSGPNLDAAGNRMWYGALPWSMVRIQIARQVLTTIFDGPLGKALEGYFGSYFRLMSLSLVRAYPGNTDGSFLWHRDFQPPQQTHLMVYLTDSSEEAGGTSFLNLEDTRAAAIGGVHFQARDSERLKDIEKVEALAGRNLNPCSPQLKAGDGVLFAAPRVLHRGNLPKSGQRDTLITLLLPSPVPWHEYLARDTRQVFVGMHPGALNFEPFEHKPLPKSPPMAPLEWAALCEMFPPGFQD